MKKPCCDGFALHQPHGAGVAVGQDGLRISSGNHLQAGGDVIQRLVPTHGFKLTAAFGADAFERRKNTFGVISTFGVFGNFGAEHAIGHGMCRIALYLDRTTIFHGGEQGAGVWTVMRADAAHDPGIQFGHARILTDRRLGRRIKPHKGKRHDKRLDCTHEAD